MVRLVVFFSSGGNRWKPFPLVIISLVTCRLASINQLASRPWNRLGYSKKKNKIQPRKEMQPPTVKNQHTEVQFLPPSNPNLERTTGRRSRGSFSGTIQEGAQQTQILNCIVKNECWVYGELGQTLCLTGAG